MKNLNTIVTIFVLIFSITLLMGCGGDDPTAQETQLKKLEIKIWRIHSVKIDGVDHSELFQGMILSFNKNSFTVVNGGQVWPTTGTWEFADDQATTIMRDDGTTVTIETIADSHLRLSLTWNETTFGPGRKKSISGKHVFDFN